MVLAMREIERSRGRRWTTLSSQRDRARKDQDAAKNNQLTKAERAILEALDSPITIDLRTPSSRMSSTSSKRRRPEHHHGQARPRCVDGRLRHAGNRGAARNVATKTVLCKVLNELGLAFVVKDETILSRRRSGPGNAHNADLLHG
jgi:hypothetical protein